MSEAKPTRGPWELWGDANPSQVISSPAGFVAQTLGSNDEANARLIAEAGTVHHETGLTPRQLVERVKELEEVVRELVAYDESDHEDSVGMMLDYSDMLKAARKALSKSLPNTVAETPK
jgi:hypothetical protein